MICDITEFKENYINLILNGYGAIFAGAGLFCKEGYLNWQKTAEKVSAELRMELGKESNFFTAAQYYKNEKGGKGNTNLEIMNITLEEYQLTDNLFALAGLPIHTYWTSTYTTLIEDTLYEMGRKADIKSSTNCLTKNVRERAAVVYKRNGDVYFPEEGIVSKYDQDHYHETRSLFTDVLRGDFATKTFLFVGFSLDDPNLEHILSTLPMSLKENRRTHYIFLVKPEPDMGYQQAKLDIRIKDMERFGIQTVLFDSYRKIDEVIADISHYCSFKKLLFSGCAAEYGKYWEQNAAAAFFQSLSKKLVEKNYFIISNCNEEIGNQIFLGAVRALETNRWKSYGDSYSIRPMIADTRMSKNYHKKMVQEAGVVLFFFGNEEVDGETVLSESMLQEFEYAKEMGKFIIPLGFTGYVAKKILNEMKENETQYSYLKKYFESLSRMEKDESMVEIVLSVIDDIKDHFMR